ncbi:MAG: transporter [Rhodobacteraceae bacterium]|jgi:outer membrane protein|nr:transporter [Paracoccaceae bacterium]
MALHFKKLAFAVAAGLILSAGSVSSQTLGSALTAAYNNSGLLEQNRALLRAADEDVAQAMSALRPIVNWSASMERRLSSTSVGAADAARTSQTVTSLGLVAELTLFDGGANKYSVEAAKEKVLAVRQSLISVEQDVLLNAIQAYMDVRSETETVALRRNNLRVIQEELRAAQDRFDVGEVTKTDVALAEARYAASNAQLAAAVGSLEQARARYRQATGVTAGVLSTPPQTPKLPATVAQAQSIALRNHPALKEQQHNIKSAEFSVAATKASTGPTLKLRGTLGISDVYDTDTVSRSATVGLNASGPVYAGGRIPSIVRKATSQLSAQKSGLHVTRRAVEQTTATAYALLEMTRASRQATQEQIRAAQVAFDGVREEATLGARTTLDVLNAEQELLNAKADLIGALADEQIAAYRVLAQMGQLTVDHLNLPVQKYDPVQYFNLVKDAPGTQSEQGKALDRVLKAINK